MKKSKERPVMEFGARRPDVAVIDTRTEEEKRRHEMIFNTKNYILLHRQDLYFEYVLATSRERGQALRRKKN